MLVAPRLYGSPVGQDYWATELLMKAIWLPSHRATEALYSVV